MKNEYGDISPRTAGFATKELLERGQHLLTLERFGQVDPQGRNKTKTRMWRRYLSLPRAVAPLAEGITPAGQRLNYVDVETTLEQFGDLVWLTDVIMDTHEDPVLQESMKICGEQAAETVEVLRYNVLRAGTNVFFPSTATTRATVNSPPTRGMFELIYRSMKRNKAREVTEIVKPSALISTEPVESAYFVVGHTDLEADISAIPGFVPRANYSNVGASLPGEIGKIKQFRIILTALAEPWLQVGASGTDYLSGGVPVTEAALCDVYPLLIFGRDCYGIVPLQGENVVKIAARNPNYEVSDPLAQRGFVSWKTYQASVILNQLWIGRAEVAATAIPE